MKKCGEIKNWAKNLWRNKKSPPF